MTEIDFFNALLDAAPIVVLLIIAGLVFLALIRAVPGIQDREIRRQEVVNDGKRIAASAEKEAHDSGNKMAELATRAMRDIIEEQRKFNAERVDSMLSGMRLLDGEIAELKEELKKKDKRIEDLERDNRQKDGRISELQTELDELRKRVDEKGRTKKGDGHETPKQATVVGSAPAAGLAGV